MLNIINTRSDMLSFYDLIGQLFISILRGIRAKQLNRDKEAIIQQLNYSKLIMLVYEGRLLTLILYYYYS